MENPLHPPPPEQSPASPEEEAVAALLRLAGPRPAVPPERHRRVHDAVRSRWRQSLPGRRRRRMALWVAGPLAAAAAVLLFIGLGLRNGVAGEIRVEVVRGSVRSPRSGELKPGDFLRVGDEIRTAPDSRMAIRLPGGVSLRLDAASRAQLLSGSSIALDQGAAYVDTGSSSGTTPRIEIRTPLGRVTETGTQFDIRLHGDSMSLRVREGLVSLDRDGRTYSAEAGRQLLIQSDGRVVSSEIARHGEEWSWTLGVAPSFDLEGRSLQEFLLWVSAETGWRVEYEERSISERAPKLLLHGSIEGIRPDEAPGAVLPACGLRHKIVEGTLMVGRL